MQRKAVVCVSLCVATPVPLSRSASDIKAAAFPSPSSRHTTRPLTSLTHGTLLLVTRHRTQRMGVSTLTRLEVPAL